MKPTLRNISLIASLSAAGVLAACGGGGGSPAYGTLSVAMTDAPACGYDEVNVTVNKVRVHQSAAAGEGEGGWTDITLNPSRRINLLNLTNGLLEELGETSLPAGRYTQLRLVLDSNTGANMANSVVLSDTKNEVPLATPSGTRSGLKVGHTFEVEADQKVSLVLDFDACKSVVTTGNNGYILKPVVNVIPTALNGIKGYVGSATNVSVSAQQDGVVVRSTVPNSQGEFFLARMEPGDYDVVITADDRATTVIAAVPVADTTSTVALSTAGAPINLQSAATPARAISGTVTLPSGSEEVAYVAAQQTFAGGPKVTIKYKGADLLNGTYTLSNLPTVAPQFGQYSATLPITFAAKSDTTPGTGKYAAVASATGVASKTVASVDVTGADQTGVDFDLR
jgi:hypothetical protein